MPKQKSDMSLLELISHGWWQGYRVTRIMSEAIVYGYSVTLEQVVNQCAKHEADLIQHYANT